MKVGELRKQGFKVIAGDTLTNGLSYSIKLSIGGAIAVNNGYHDDLEVVDLLWRYGVEDVNGYQGVVITSFAGWKPYLGRIYGEDKSANSNDETPVFTQAMADAYKMPPVGSWFTLHYYEHDSRFNDMNGHDFEVIGINDDVYTFRNYTKGFGALKLNPINCQPIDNRTEKQKAVDAAFLAFNVDKPTLEAIYDLWDYKIEQ